MRSRKSTIVLTALAVLFAQGCATSKKTTRSEIRNQSTEIIHDTLRTVVLQQFHDTLREVTTVSVQLNARGDTLRVTTVTDRTRAIDRDHSQAVKEKIIVKRDTLYLDKSSDQLIAAVGPNTEIDSAGNITPAKPTFQSTLKWVFRILLAVIALLVIMYVIHVLKKFF